MAEKSSDRCPLVQLDLDVAFTSPGVLATGLDFTDRAPVWQRVLGAIVAGLLVTIA